MKTKPLSALSQSSLSRRRLPAPAGLLLAAVLSSGCASRAGTGDGQVIDFVTSEPIPHARVELDCAISKRFHGSIKETYTTESRADGAYHFDPSGLERCDYFFARAVKPGYGLDGATHALTLPDADTARSLPKIVYLIKERDLPLVRIRHLAHTIPVRVRASDPDRADYFRFRSTYGAFTEARQLATTPELQRIVREKFCPALQAADAAMLEQERARMHEDVTTITGAVLFTLRPDTYEKQVRPYCAG